MRHSCSERLVVHRDATIQPVTDTLDAILETLRGRVLRGLQAGTLRPGDRLPSTREVGTEFGVDHRVALAAYRTLVDDGLVELRPRGGIYVAPRPSHGVTAVPEGWIVDVLTEGFTREIPGPELHEWLRRCTETLRLRAVVIATTDDQLAGLCRELHDDFGIDAEALAVDALPSDASAPQPLAVRRADLLVTTEAHAERLTALGAALRKPVVVLEVRPDLVAGEWALLLRRPVWAVVASVEFGEMLRAFFSGVPGSENLRILVFGQDDLATIPPGAPTYVTRRVRDVLGNVHVPGRVLPAARTIAPRSARALFAFVVRTNLEAMGARR